MQYRAGVMHAVSGLAGAAGLADKLLGYRYLEDVQKLFHHLWPQLLRHSISMVVRDICEDLQQQ